MFFFCTEWVCLPLLIKNLIFDNHLQNLGQQGWREPKSGTRSPLWHEAHGRGCCWGGQTRGVLTSLTLPMRNSFLDIPCKTFRSFLNRWRSPGWRWALWDREELPLQAMTMRLAVVRAGERLSFSCFCHNYCLLLSQIFCCCCHSHCYCYCDHHHHQDQCSREVAAGLGCWVPADTSGCLRPEVVAAQVSFDVFASSKIWSKGSTRMSFLLYGNILYRVYMWTIWNHNPTSRWWTWCRL